MSNLKFYSKVPCVVSASILLCCLLASAVCAQPQSTLIEPWTTSQQMVYNFGMGVWPENLIMRPDGRILGGLITEPLIYQIDPGTGRRDDIHTFQDKDGVLAFAETESDLYFVVASNLSVSGEKASPGSTSIYRLDMRGHAPTISKLLDLSQAYFIDGMDTVNAKNGLLIAGDSTKGKLYLIDTNRGTSKMIHHSTALEGTSKSFVGLDGLKIQGNYMYFSNDAQKTFGRVPINPQTGRITGKEQILCDFTKGSMQSPVDDFVFHPNGSVYLTLIDYGLGVAHPPNYSKVDVIAAINGPTAARFGRAKDDSQQLYITSTGGNTAFANSTFIIPALLSKITLS